MDDRPRPTINSQQEQAASESQKLKQQDLLLQLWDEFAAGMLRHALASTGSREASQEAVQEAFTTVLGRIRMGDHLPDWKLALYEALRAAIELRATSGEAPDESDAGPGYELPDLDAPLRAAEVREQMLQLVSSREFEMLQLRADGFSYAEIARVLSISPGTVASSLAKAFRKIRTGYNAGTQS